MGYRAGTAAMVNMSDATEKLAKAANIMGIFVIGALSATFIKVQTTASLELGGKVVELQTALFDKIMPNLLPLCLVFLMYKMVKSTGFLGVSPRY
ncbi:N-acetylgalactosamine-specific PTS system, EIID component [Proteus mirabilis]|uniref:N-acetylgalactosamine-specific PTS system, EIID component n=1 Tax=Proteus mirabilis TaxID=584 RepID=A0A379GEF7_PROMI|nr:N-acetylgalactosamine-specific PTS system, EIID component [Proteus mirabilis]